MWPCEQTSRCNAHSGSRNSWNRLFGARSEMAIICWRGVAKQVRARAQRGVGEQERNTSRGCRLINENGKVH